MRRATSSGLLNWDRWDAQEVGGRDGRCHDSAARMGDTGKGRRTAGADMILLWSCGGGSRRVLGRGEHG